MKVALQVTMFRDINYGSALQTYALHTILQGLGLRCLTVDYPIQAGVPSRRVCSLGRLARRLFSWLVYRRRNRLYDRFLRRELNLTRPYWSFDELCAQPPVADVYVTGSDQTFNPSFSGADSTYFLRFVPASRRGEVRKLSYASSFAVSSIPAELTGVYREALSDYDAISTREENGIRIVKEITGRTDAAWCCDPTILLTQDQWKIVAGKAERRARGKYILVYLMAYMVNPFPGIERIIREAQRETGYEVIYLNGRKQDVGKPHSRVIKNASPYEFVDLFLNAALVITSSFHGMVFSLQAGVPFLACVDEDETKDSRGRSLLRRIGANKHILPVPIRPEARFGKVDDWAQEDAVGARLNDFRQFSLDWLRRNI